MFGVFKNVFCSYTYLPPLFSSSSRLRRPAVCSSATGLLEPLARELTNTRLSMARLGFSPRGFYLCTLKKDVTFLRIPQKLVVTYMPSLELFFSLTPFRRHLLLTVGNGSGE